MKIKDLLEYGIKQLKKADSARLDSEILLMHIIGKNKSYLIANNNESLTKDVITKFEKLIAKRAEGVPVAYLTGVKEFWTLALNVNPDVLIPRPETETLVELAIEYLSDNVNNFTTKYNLIDLGTGSGAIALAIADNFKEKIKVIATDKSIKALEVAKLNATKLNIENVIFKSGDWFSALQELDSEDRKFNCIVSNPPYIACDDKHLDGEIRFEPKSALEAGEKGLDDLFSIIEKAPDYLLPGGCLLLEIGHSQGQEVLAKLEQHGFTNCHITKDLAGLDRVASGLKHTL